MRPYQFLKRLVPVGWKDKLKAGYRSAESLPKDIAARVRSRLGGGARVPPADLIFLVSGHRSASRFLSRGREASRTILDTLERNGVEVERFHSVLDFGCGVGRVIRHWDLPPHVALHGTDYNPLLVRWCRENLKSARFQFNSLSGGLPYAPETFDFIYAISVFTHLSEPLQSFWMGELFRVLKPGGYFLFTTHGDHFLPHLGAEEKERYLNGHLIVRAAERSGANMCSTYHPPAYVRGRMSGDFRVVDFIPGRAGGDLSQDVYLFKKPGSGRNKSAG